MNKTWPNPTVQTLPDQVAEVILQRIATGELQPGHRLPSQRELAQSMGVGLAVIREAVQRLATLNIVEASHGSGTIIRPFRWLPLLYDKSLFHLAMQRIGIHDLWEARRLLEGQIVRLAVERRTVINLERMQAVLDDAKPLPASYDASQGLNRKFHRALAEASQNAVLVDLLDPLLDVQTEGASHRFKLDHCRRTWEAHETIYKAVADRKMTAAERAIEDHFKVGPIALQEIEARGGELLRRLERGGDVDEEFSAESVSCMLRFDTVIGDFPALLLGVPLTLGLTAVAFLAGSALALPIAVVRTTYFPGVSQIALVWIEFFRTTPPLMHIVWAYYALPAIAGVRLDAFSVVAGALACSTSAQMAEIFRGGILAVPRGQWDASQVLGLTSWQRLWWVVLPQTVRLVLAPACNTLVSLLKQSSLAAVIALPEIMNRGWILAAQTFRPLEVLTLVALIYFVLTWPLVLLTAALEKRSALAFRAE